MGGGSGRQGLVNALKQLRAVFAGEVECAGANKVLKYPAIDRFGVQTAAVIIDMI